ncbi:MAG: sulfatase [bacterium]|nr:sulfatase [bacterium]
MNPPPSTRRHPKRSAAILSSALGLVIPCLAFLGAACTVTDERPCVLLVVIDTLRADKLGCYGNPRGLTPAIDQLAREGVVFERAFAHAPWTLPSVASLLTSLHPQEHGAGGWLDLSGLPAGGPTRPRFQGLDAEIETLAERFHDAGYATAAVSNVDFLAEEFGLAQGFEHVDARRSDNNRDARTAAATTASALDWLSGHRRRPFFLMVHYFDPHAVYAPPPAFRRRFAAPRDRTSEAFVFGTRQDLLRLRGGRIEPDRAVLARAERLYDGEIAYTDSEIGRLLAGLDELRLKTSTLIVVTADHGEEFLDHGGFEHGHTLYDELLRVPLILRLPSVLPPQRIARRVRLIDVAPTLCELTGVAVAESFTGRSLLAPEAELTDRPVLAHGNFWGPPLMSWYSGPYKLILTPGPAGAERAELYVPTQDPGEQRDLSSVEPQVVERLKAELREQRRWLVARARGTEIELGPQERERLRALGYLGE